MENAALLEVMVGDKLKADNKRAELQTEFKVHQTQEMRPMHPSSHARHTEID